MTCLKRSFSTGFPAFFGASALSLALGGCSSSDKQAVVPGTTGDTLNACDSLDLAKPDDGIQLQLQLPLEAGQEREVCQLVKLDQDINVNWSEGVYTKGSHHALVDRTAYVDTIPATAVDGETLDGTQIHNCQTPSALWKSGGVIAGGHPVGEQEAGFSKGILPDNVAMKLHQNEFVLLNFHMLNTSASPINACYKVNFHGIPAAQATQEAGTIFFYNPFITVPQSGEATARMACPITQDITLATAVSHAHKRLDGYTSKLLSGDPSMGGSEMQMLYQGTEWDNPQANVFAQPLSLTKGQWIDYQCHFTNPEARNVAQGFQTTDEMCMFIGAYWPRNEALENCGGTGSNPGASRLNYGSGTMNGAQVLSCITSSPGAFSGGGPATSEARYATLGCVTGACPQIAPQVSALLHSCADRTSATCGTAVTAIKAATCN